MSAFVRGMLQPLALPTHALALLALGLLISQQQARRRLLLSAAFVAGLAAGLAAIALAVGPTPAADVVLAAAGLAGLLVAIGRPLPALGCALLVAVAGAALGLDSPPQATSIAAGTIMLIGTGLGASLALAFVVAGALAGALAGAQGPAWPRIGVRVLGSWIAASAMLVLALRFARGQLL
jgi:urease accessory protein